MNRLLALFLCSILGFTAASQGQLCEGSLGDEIFEEGDFGSGAPNVVQNDPGIAPGYQYTTNVPPNDGFYTITNNMAVWPYLFGGWIPITDDSDDPEGYFMVVNASFNPGLFYEQVVDGLCENTTYEFSASIINILDRNTGGTLPNVSFFIDNDEFYRTGPIQQTNDWQKVGFTFTTEVGQTSAVLTLRNNAPGGIGNDLALDNISFRACGPNSTIRLSTDNVICEDDQFPVLLAEIDSDSSTVVQWQVSDDNGTTWADLPGADSTAYQTSPMPPGPYLFRFINATSPGNLVNEKCRIISDTLSLLVIPLQYAIFDTLCQGLSYTLGEAEYSETGVYMETFISSFGCDSIVTLHLTIVDDPGVNASIGTEEPQCFGGDDGLLFLNSVENGVSPYMVFVDGISISVDTLMLPAGTYTVAVEDRYGCADEQFVTVPNPPEYLLTSPGGLEVQLGYSLDVEIVPNLPTVSVEWAPTEGLSCTDCLVNTIDPANSIVYEVSAISDRGCTDTISLAILVDKTVQFFLPNVITSNGDGINDEWIVGMDPVSVIEIDQVVVVDRWGNIVFERNNIPSGQSVPLWNGMSNDEFAPAGVYAYSIVFRRADGVLTPRSGSITVIR